VPRFPPISPKITERLIREEVHGETGMPKSVMNQGVCKMKMCALFLLLFALLGLPAWPRSPSQERPLSSMATTIEVHGQRIRFTASMRRRAGRSACGPMVRLGAVANRRPGPVRSNRSFRSSLRSTRPRSLWPCRLRLLSRTRGSQSLDGRQWLGCGVSEILTRLRGR